MSQRRKSLCVLSGVITSSQIFSSLGIQLVARWQFCNTTHVPSLIARVIMLAAIGPCTEGAEGGRRREGWRVHRVFFMHKRGGPSMRLDSYLSLPEGDRLASCSSKPLVLCKLEQPCHRVGSRGQHKYEGSTAVGVSKTTSKVKGRRLNVLSAHVVYNKVLHCWHNLVRTQAPQYHHPGRGLNSCVSVFGGEGGVCVCVCVSVSVCVREYLSSPLSFVFQGSGSFAS